MKRFLLSIFLLTVGVGLGAGGLYVATNWERLNPFRDKKDHAAKEFLSRLRKSCAADDALKGAFIKSADVADGKLALRGIVASKEQIAQLETKAQSFLSETPELKAQCTNGLSVDVFKVVAIADQLSQFQRDFEEGKGAEKNTGDNPRKREVMRMTRLDSVAFDEDGKLAFTGVCIRGEKNKDASRELLLTVLKSRLEAVGVTSDLMPDIRVDVRFFANPIATLQKKLSQDERTKGARMLAAFYTGNGRLHLDGIVANDDERHGIEKAAEALILNMPDIASTAAELERFPGLLKFDISAVPLETGPELQTRLVHLAVKESKPYLRHVKIAAIALAPQVNDKKELIADEEGNPTYVFRVTGRLLETGDERKKIESELPDWLEEALPRMINANQMPIATKLELVVKENPIVALQEQMVQRGLDGTMFTDATYDDKGQLELFGRLHGSTDEAKKTLEAAVKDLLADEVPWTIAALKPHEAAKDGAPIAWSEVVRDCQAKLAQGGAAGARIRLDRLHFAFDKRQLQLVGVGVFLEDSKDENLLGVLAKTVDAVILTRGRASGSTSGLKALKNPVVDWQNTVAQRADLDGAILTNIRYDADGRLHVDGYLGQAEHKAILATLLAARLDKTSELVKKSADPKATPAWSIDAMKVHAAAKGELTWSDLVKSGRSELASDPQGQRTCLDRLFLRYAEPKGAKPRQMVLQGKAVHLLKPGEKIDESALALKLDALGKRMLPDLAIDHAEIELQKADTPIFELQKLAVAAGNDGILLKEISYDRDGKLAFAGIRGSAEQSKVVKELIEKYVKDRPTLAPHGVASLDNLKLVPWQPLLQEIRTSFAEAGPLYKQTRVDRIEFQFDETKSKAIVTVKGICIYQGIKPVADEQFPVLTATLKKQLQAKGVEGFELSLAGIERKPNPVAQMQKKANDTRMDGVDFTQLGFDAKGNCYVKLPLIPKGQEENIRKLLEEFSKKNPHLKAIQQQAP